MKRVMLMMIVALALSVSFSFATATGTVKSKRGDLDVMSHRGGGSVVCTAGFNDELVIVQDAETEVLVKGRCGQGWVEKSKVEYVAKGPGDKSIVLTEFDIRGWIYNPSAVFVLKDDNMDFDGVKIDRDFKEYLTRTVDREETERRHGEN